MVKAASKHGANIHPYSIKNRPEVNTKTTRQLYTAGQLEKIACSDCFGLRKRGDCNQSTSFTTTSAPLCVL